MKALLKALFAPKATPQPAWCGGYLVSFRIIHKNGIEWNMAYCSVCMKGKVGVPSMLQPGVLCSAFPEVLYAEVIHA